MLSALLSEIVDRLPPERDVDDRLRMIAESPWERVLVHREFFLIDVVVEIISAQGVVHKGWPRSVSKTSSMLGSNRSRSAGIKGHSYEVFPVEPEYWPSLRLLGVSRLQPALTAWCQRWRSATTLS
jgi:hypothetical protein